MNTSKLKVILWTAACLGFACATQGGVNLTQTLQGAVGPMNPLKPPSGKSQRSAATSLSSVAVTVTNFVSQVEDTRALQKEVDAQLREAATQLHVASSIQQNILVGLRSYLGQLAEIERVEVVSEARFAELWLRYKKAIDDQSQIAGMITILTAGHTNSALHPQAILKVIADCQRDLEALERRAGPCHDVTSRTIASLLVVERHYTNAVAMTEASRQALRHKLDALQAKTVAAGATAAGLSAALVAQEVELQRQAKRFNPLDFIRVQAELRTVVGLIKMVDRNAAALKDLKEYTLQANVLFAQIDEQGPRLCQANAEIRQALTVLKETNERCLRQRGMTEQEIAALAARDQQAIQQAGRASDH